MSTNEEALTDSAIQLHGESLHSLRVSQKKWFLFTLIAITAYVVTVGFVAFRRDASGVVALFALPLFIVVFQAGRLAGRVETVERVRMLNRR
jgi:hypothetical protein